MLPSRARRCYVKSRRKTFDVSPDLRYACPGGDVGVTAARVQPMRPDSNQLFTSEQAFLRPFCPCGVKSFYVIWRAYLKIMGRMPA